MKITLMGDSLTVGYAMEFEKLADKSEVTVIAKIGASIEWLKNQPMPSHSTVLLMAGTNDLMGAPVSTVVTRLEALVIKLQQHNNRVIVGTIPLMNNGKIAESTEYNSKILDGRFVAAPVGSLIPLNQYASDGIHLTANGYRELAYIWYHTWYDDMTGRNRPKPQTDRGPIPLLIGAAAMGAMVYLATRKG